jgi:hypothetical protein
MTRSRCAALVLCVSAAVAVLTLARPAAAQRSPSVPFAYRADAFRRILFELGLTPLKNFAELGEDPKHTLLIVLGRTDCLDPDILQGSLQRLVREGGAALVATDRAPDPDAASELLAVAGVAVSGERFVGPPDEEDALYHGKDFCPKLDPATGVTPDLFRGPPRLGIPALTVATNAPSCLKGNELPEGIRSLAWLPYGSHAEGTRPPPPAKSGMRFDRFVPMWRKKGPLFAVGGSVGDGRVLVLADHSIFINQMMIPTDNGNAEFAWNCLEWLRGEGDQRRHKVLFVEDGFIQTDFKVPLKGGPGLPPGAARAAVVVIDDALARLEDKGTLDEALLDRLGASRFENPNPLLRRALEFVTVILLVYLIYRIGIRGRFRLDAGVPLLAHEVARHTPGAPLLEQRFRSALRAGNLWETAHGLARQWFASLPPAAGAAPPRVVVRGGWWRRSSLQRRFTRLWRLAHETAPVRVSPRALRRMLRDLDEMKAALADGTLRLP